MSSTSQYSPNVTGRAARCFADKLQFLSRIEGIRAISIKRPVKKPRSKKLVRAQRKVWKEEGSIQNNTQRIVWHNAWIQQTFILIF